MSASFDHDHRRQLFAALEAEQGSAYFLRADLSLAYVNQAWLSFARENGAAEIENEWHNGAPVTDFFAPPLREYFELRFTRALRTQEGFSHAYECSSATRYRTFMMRVQPTASHDGLIVVHSRVIEADLSAPREALSARIQLFTDGRGLIVRCAACGRVRDRTGSRWDWAPGLVRPDTNNVSHGMCPTCDFHYYSGAAH